MFRFLSCIAAFAWLALPCRADEPPASTETSISLGVEPAFAPKPALRYVFLPEFGETNPGNPIQDYIKCFMEQQKFFFDKQEVERRESLLAMPLKELPAQELQDYGGPALRQADWAARLDKPDWQIILPLKADGYRTMIPDVQQMRVLTSALKVRLRAEVALGHFDAAVRTAKTLFAMSRHLGEHPTFVGELVGIAVASAAIGPLEEMLQQPGCPNLYWALTYLPTPLVPLDKGADGERYWIQPLFRDLDDSAAMSAERLTSLISQLLGLIDDGEEGGPSPKARDWVDHQVKDEKLLGAARRRLVEIGIPEERLRTFPAEQVILLDVRRECEERHDDALKLIHLPVWEVDHLSAQMDKAPPLFDTAPAIARVRRAQTRLDQRIALLRHVEALRLYAAEHEGALPVKLSDVAVPLPADPFDGKPFQYEVQGGTAHLRGRPPASEEQNPAFKVHYEITLRVR
ncbi:MAG TPA: hypothetical protein VGX78_19090 [Pirellulales bacterium]|jgi:hypothetical protein|nr:hypothetical protein [Pirellulales bacterium]